MLRFTFPALARAVVMTAEEAVADIPNGATVGFGGFGPCGMSFELLTALNKAGPKDLTLVGILMGGPHYGTGPLARDKQIKRAITTYVNYNKPFTDALFRGEFELEFSPMGNLLDRVRAAGNGMRAFYTPTGYGTNVTTGGLPMRFSADGSGRIEQVSQPRETRCVDGVWCTYEKALPIDYGLVKAWKADRMGNVIFRGTTRNFNIGVARAASKASIVEVEEIVEVGELDPNAIHLPSIYVDRLVEVKNPRKIFVDVVADKASSGDTTDGKKPSKEELQRQLRIRDQIARRAVMEIKPGMTLNLGVGIPNAISKFLPPNSDILLQGENGILGLGPPPSDEEADPDFTNAGMAKAQGVTGYCLFDSEESFCMIRGGHMDLTVLGALQVSGTGDIASWYVPGKVLSGPGGAMDLTACCPRRIVLMEHTTKSGEPRIVQRCTVPLTAKAGVDLLITDLATFEFVYDKAAGISRIVLTELADGITLDEVKAKTGATFDVSPNLEKQELAPVS